MRQKNILMYVRKSNDVDEILDALRDCVLYIAEKTRANHSDNRSF